MTKATEEQLRKLWDVSIPLSKAWHTFARAEDRARWKTLYEASASDAFVKGMEAVSESDEDGFAKLQKALSNPQKALSERATHRSKLQRDLLHRIQNGHLRGYGFETPRTLNSAPVAIPKRAWSSDCVHWETNTLTFESIKFVEVRLTTNRIRNEILERGQVDTTPVNSPGRPGVQKHIKDAFYALEAANEIDPSKSQSSHFPKVRAWLELQRPDVDASDVGMSTETIRRHFSPLFRDLKKTK